MPSSLDCNDLGGGNHGKLLTFTGTIASDFIRSSPKTREIWARSVGKAATWGYADDAAVLTMDADTWTRVYREPQIGHYVETTVYIDATAADTMQVRVE